MPTKYSTPTAPTDPFLEFDRLCRFLEDFADPSRGQQLSDESLADYKRAIGDFFFTPINQNYLENCACQDLISNIDLESIYTIPRLAGRAKNYTVDNNIQIAADTLLNAIMQRVNQGDVALFSLLAKYRFGHTSLHLKNDPSHIYNRTAELADNNEGLLIGHMIKHLLLTQGKEKILSGNAYTAPSVAFLAKYIPEDDMLKLGSTSIKRHLLSNDLNL
jgi:hypothetical protein